MGDDNARGWLQCKIFVVIYDNLSVFCAFANICQQWTSKK